MESIDFITLVENFIWEYGGVEEKDGYYIVTIGGQSHEIPQDQVLHYQERLRDFRTESEYAVWNDNYYEVQTIDINTVSHLYFSFAEQMCHLEDTENKIVYDFSLASPEFLLHYFTVMHEQTPPDRYEDLRFLTRKLSVNLKKYPDDFFKALARSMQVMTIKIESENPKKLTNYEDFGIAYLYGIGANLNIPLFTLASEKGGVRINTNKFRRIQNRQLNTPKRFYINDLVLYYQKGIGSECYDAGFLSFYHILEYFFAKTYREDLVETVQNELSKDTFSFKQKPHIQKLIKLIQERTGAERKEQSEREDIALLVTLRKFIPDIQVLRNELESIDPALIDYFRDTEIPFSRKARAVDFDSSQTDGIYEDLADRIFSIRNSIINSKITDKTKYKPVRDDEYLVRENMLMRIISETVLFTTSRAI